jgi:dolichol-phosphate mannosyltransferase
VPPAGSGTRRLQSWRTPSSPRCGPRRPAPHRCPRAQVLRFLAGLAGNSATMTTTPGSRCVVVVPTYNEAETIRSFLDDVLCATVALDATVLVVDDNSPDGTGDLVRAHPDFGSRVELLARERKDGLGAAYRAGFGRAVKAHYDVVVQVDADGSHPVSRIPAMVAALDRYELVIGSRYVPGGRTIDWPAGRRLLSRGANQYVRTMLGLRTRDATAGFRAWRASTLVDLGVLATGSGGYCFQIECTWRAERDGARVHELPITFTERRAGASKMSRSVAIEAVVRVLQWRVHELVGSTTSVSVLGGEGAS